MDMEFEGMEQDEDEDEAEAIKRMALHGGNVPDDTWDLPRGLDYDWSKLYFPRISHLWKNAGTSLEDAIYMQPMRMILRWMYQREK
jgi:hypothetical protein